jgi:hypothetical protein
MKPEQKKTLLNYTPYKSDLKGWKKQKARSIKSKTNIKWHLKYKQMKKKPQQKKYKEISLFDSISVGIKHK